MSALMREPQHLPVATEPDLDDGMLAGDAKAVQAAEAALAAWRAPSAAPVAAPAAHTVTVSRTSSREVQAAEADLARADHDVVAAQSELDRLLAAQEQASDPSAYDGQVAAAREELDQATARQGEAQSALTAARSRKVTVQVTPSARPRATPPAAAKPRAPLVLAVTEARQVQAAHLASRRQAVAAWRADQQARTARATALNAHVRECSGRAAVPVSAGLAMATLGSAALGWRRWVSGLPGRG
ncbi:MAG TPA: hypothetical protein VMZ11_01735 [Mycobacteriales bacterium]|nr:hypothetical protein [Mycobacteriales bacterium]